jgi:cation diffusion facilitator family transporter
MHTQSLEPWQHQHVFLGERHDRHERRTWLVVALTSAMMVAEIVAGSLFGSMALLADGWHMSTHAGALMIAALAYRFARHHAHDARFAFGTGKLGELAAFSSAIILAVIALLIAYQSIERLFSPVPIRFGEAIAVAAIGLAVNLISAWLLFDRDHHHHHDHPEEEGHHHVRDHNLRAAYFHVLADALTSVTALVGLAAGSLYGWVWMDPLMGIAGALVIAHWSLGLIRASGAVLLDAVPEARLPRQIRKRLETAGDRVADLHVWRVGPGHIAVIAAVVSDHPAAPADYKARLNGISGLSHVTIEVHACTEPSGLPAAA